MKRIIPSLVVFAALAGSVAASSEAQPTSLSFNYKLVAAKKHDVDRWRSSSGSYDRDTNRSRTIEVEVRNLSNKPAKDVKLWVVWIARDNNAGSEPYIVRRDEAKLNAERTTTTHSFTSPLVKENNVRYSWMTTGYSSGSKMIGYIIGMEYGGHTYAPQASTGVREFLRPGKLDALAERRR